MAKNSNNVLALGVGLNLDPLTQDIANAAKTAKEGMDVISKSVVDGGQKAEGATEKLGDKVQSMRSQLRQATQDAQQMAEKYGVMSQQAISSASRAGQLKDKIGDINTVITAFSADSKFTVVAGALQQAAGAASIVTGSMALLGVESKETEAMLLKVQGALALTQGLATIKEMGAAFTALQAVIVGQVIPSLSAMGTAMNIALGVAGIALAAIITAVVMYNNSLDEEANALKAATEAQKANNEAIADSQKIIITTQGLRTRAMKEGLEKELRQNKDKLAIEIYDNELAYSQGLISAATFENRKIYIKQNFANEEEKIRKAFHLKDLEDAKKHKKSLNVIYSQPLEIQNQFAGGGQMNLPELIMPSAPTKLGLSPLETMAFRIKQDAEKARIALLNAKVLLIETQTKLFEDLKNITEQGIANTFGSVGQAIGDSLAASLSNEDADMMDAIGVAIVKSLGQMAVQVGSMLIALSVPMMLAGLPTGYAYAAAGTGLIAVGSMVSGLAGRKSQGGTTSETNLTEPTSNFNGNGSNYIGGNNSGNIVINGMIKGNDIQLVNGRNDRKFNRSLKFG